MLRLKRPKSSFVAGLYYLTFPYLVLLISHWIDHLFRGVFPSPITTIVLFGVVPIWGIMQARAGSVIAIGILLIAYTINFTYYLLVHFLLADPDHIAFLAAYWSGIAQEFFALVEALLAAITFVMIALCVGAVETRD